MKRKQTFYQKEQAWADYGEFLITLLNFSRSRYDCLLNELHFYPFFSDHPMDKNRICDGISLREDYGEWGIEPPFKGGDANKASVLEVLVALSFRIDREWIGDPMEPHPEIIFWEMICNLGLQRFNNRYFDKMEVDHILYSWCSRRYDEYGQGSIFPVRKLHKGEDMRNFEIWDQMMLYLTENYSI